MEAADRIEMRQKKEARSKRRWRCCGVILLVIIALAVGLGVGLSQRFKDRKERQVKYGRPLILLPMYSQPDNSAWQPLFEQLGKHLDTDFTVIIKPTADGPEIPSALSPLWKQSVTGLNSYNNTRLLGYIDTKNSTKLASEIQDEAREYASWRVSNGTTNGTTNGTAANPLPESSLTLQGLFFDNPNPELGQAPDTTNPESKNPNKLFWNMCDEATWMNEDEGGFGKRNPQMGELDLHQMAVHNPPAIPTVYDYLAGSVTVVFEGSYEDYLKQRDDVDSIDLTRFARALLVHSFPMDEDLGKAVKEMNKVAKHLYVTDLKDPDYTEFGKTWEAFVNAVAEIEDFSRSERLGFPA